MSPGVASVAVEQGLRLADQAICRGSKQAWVAARTPEAEQEGLWVLAVAEEVQYPSAGTSSSSGTASAAAGKLRSRPSAAAGTGKPRTVLWPHCPFAAVSSPSLGCPLIELRSSEPCLPFE